MVLKRESILLLTFAIFSLVAARSAAAGQQEATIYGIVTDESGGVLPGVTVTATSPALQVPSMTAITGAGGEYRLTPLPIGTYQLNYTLQGFQTARQEALRLTAGFAMKLDVRMSVGSLAETITVSGASPVVDVTQTMSGTVLTSETLELTPTARQGLNTLYAQVPGVRSMLDVGGSSLNQEPVVSSFGQAGGPTQAALEGVVTRFAAYWNYLSVEEAQVSTVGSTAEMEARGVQVNAIVKSGGNQFHGEAGFTLGGRLESSNISDELEAQGITAGNDVKYRDDFFGDFGGRIKRDKLWSYTAWRLQRESQEVIDAFKPDGSAAQALQQAHFLTEKITYQMTPQNRIVGFYAWSQKHNESGASRFVPWDSRTIQNNNQDLAKGEWQSLKGNWLVFSAQYGYWGHVPSRISNPNGAPGQVRTQDIATQYITGPSTRAGLVNYQNFLDMRLKATIYRPNLFMGDHEFKTGYTNSYTDFGRRYPVSDYLPLPNYRLRFQNSTPVEIEVPNYPNNPKVVTKYNAVFLQDKWTIGGRLTLNAGFRYSHDEGFAPAACREAAIAPANLAFPAGCVGETRFPDWRNWDPRLHAAFDLTGDAKTVLKGGWAAFSHQNFVDELVNLDSNAPGTARYRWRDLNGNRNYDPGEVNLDPNGPDFITQSIIVGQANPDLIVPSLDELMVSVERQLFPNLAVRVLGLYSNNIDNYRVANVKRPYESYNIPVTRPDPGPDGTVGTADDPGVNFTYFEYSPTLSGQLFELPTYVNDPRSDQTFKSIEFGVNRRFAGGWQLSGSYEATKKHVPYFDGLMITETSTLGLTSGAPYNPNEEINKIDDSWESDSKVSGSYQIPYDIRLGVNYQYRSGRAYSRTVLFSGGRTIPSMVLNVEPYGTRRLPNINLLDFRAEKTINLPAGRRLSVRANLYNLLNASTVTALNSRSGSTFLRPSTILPARTVEINLSFTF
jgi:Carboxypeptidase regulatory-like domain/TonB dependent receptor-like, beta-barrel